MLKGIYFLETNSSVLSDMEGCFTINDAFVYKGGCGVIREAVKQLEKMQDVSFVVISDRLIDGNCEEALEQLSQLSAQIIVATSTNDELMRTRLAKRAKLLPYPYSYEELDTLLKKICGSSSYEDGEIDDIANSDISRDVDNPFSAGKKSEDTPAPEPVIRKSSFQDRLKDVQLSKTSERAGRLMPQHTVVIYNQKGGVGKSTIAKELAIAMTCLSIQKGKDLYRPKVCLCDFDLDSSDVSSLLGLPLEPSIKQWSDDISKQYEKLKKMDTVFFSEWDIKQNYLQQHESGLYVLVAPEIKTEGLSINYRTVSTIIENLKLCEFDVIIIDTGSNIFDYTISAILAATDILALSTCDVVSAKRIDGVLEDILLNVDGFDRSRMKLLINRYDPTFNITPEELSGVLQMPLIGVIPDCREITNVNNGGNSVFYGNTRSTDKQKAFANAVRSVAKRLLELDAGEGSVPMEIGKSSDRGLFSFLFRRK